MGTPPSLREMSMTWMKLRWCSRANARARSSKRARAPAFSSASALGVSSETLRSREICTASHVSVVEVAARRDVMS